MAYKAKAAEVSKLRKTTGAGMMDCKKALEEANGDFNKAIEVLRKKGQKVASKRADRDTTEGAVITVINEDKDKGSLVALGCETDFVAKNEDFVALATKLAEIALNYDTKEDFMSAGFDKETTVEDKLIEQTGVIGEKLEINAFEVLRAPFVGSYIHQGNKIAALVGLSENVENAEDIAKNVAMQVAAMNPVALDSTKVDQAIIDKEIEIAKDQLRQEGKPEAMLDQITKGKLKKFFKDNTLMDQDFVMGDKQSVKQYLNTHKDGLKVTDYKRFAI